MDHPSDLYELPEEEGRGTNDDGGVGGGGSAAL